MVGEVPLDWQDVWHYHLCTGRLGSVEERIILKQLSDAYVEGKLEGRDPLSISPHEREEDI